MDKTHEYVPAKQVIEKFLLFDNDEEVEVDDELFHQILLGGDQLTVARARGSITARLDHQSQKFALFENGQFFVQLVRVTYT